MNTPQQSPEESAPSRAPRNWREGRAVQRLFPWHVVFFATVAVIAVITLVLVARPMLETPYAPGVTVRFVAAAILLALSAWLVTWVVVHGGRWLVVVSAVLIAVLVVPLFGWAAVTWANPLGGPVGTASDPAYLGERFEVAVAEGPAGGQYSVVTGTALQVIEVARDQPPRPPEAHGYDYYADARCWAVQIELTTRYDERLEEQTDDLGPLPFFRPSVTLTAADGTVAFGELWEDDGCEHAVNSALSTSYRTPSAGAGVTTDSMWIMVQLPTNQLPTRVEVDLNGSGAVSYYVPEVTPDACGTFGFCGGLLTLYDQSRVWGHFEWTNEYYWERAAMCSPPNEPESWCGG